MRSTLIGSLRRLEVQLLKLRKINIYVSWYDIPTNMMACNFIKKRLQHRVFPMNITKFFKNNFFYKAPPMAALGSQKV